MHSSQIVRTIRLLESARVPEFVASAARNGVLAAYQSMGRPGLVATLQFAKQEGRKGLEQAVTGAIEAVGRLYSGAEVDRDPEVLQAFRNLEGYLSGRF